MQNNLQFALSPDFLNSFLIIETFTVFIKSLGKYMPCEIEPIYSTTSFPIIVIKTVENVY